MASEGKLYSCYDCFFYPYLYYIPYLIKKISFSRAHWIEITIDLTRGKNSYYLKNNSLAYFDIPLYNLEKVYQNYSL